MKFKKIFLLLFINLIIFTTISNATIILENNISKEYEKWLNISEEEKSDYIMPPIHTIDLETENDSSQKFSLFNITASSNGETLPTKYNIADTVDITVRNQGITDSCWAIAAVEMFETNNAKMKNLDEAVTYSSRHMDYSSSKYFLNNTENAQGFNRKVGEGANYEVAMAYFTSGKGPILEEDMPFENNINLINIFEIQNKTVQSQLKDYTKYPNIYKSYDENNNVSYSNGKNLAYTEEQIIDFRNNIKNQIMKYGAVGSYTYVPRNKEDYNYFSHDNGIFYGNSYFCNNSDLTMNHSICIVGWDDTYSKENFKEGCQPIHDGAYIALNSWGTDWNNNNGYYYISYDDYFIELAMYGIQNISDVEYDNIYQYDELGNNFALTSSSTPSYIYGANIFNKKNNNREKLTNVGVYIYNDKTSVEVYISNKNESEIDVSTLECIGNGIDLTAGYHVIDIDTDIYLNDEFMIIVKFINENVAKLPIEANYSSLGYTDMKTRYNTATANAGESFVSLDGKQWNDLTEKYPNANICIKAFTINETQNASNTDYIKNTKWKLIKGNNVTMISGIEENTTISELLSTDNFSSNYTVKAYKNGSQVTTGNVTTGTVIKIFDGSNVVQEYTVIIYGDTNLDGDIASIDALIIVKNKLGIESFKNEISEEAGRVTSKTRKLNLIPSAVDALAVVKNKLELEKISQY